MRVQVRLFAAMADRAGMGVLPLELRDGATVADARAALMEAYPRMPWTPGTMIAVNQEYAAGDRVLAAGDEVAVIPPVSGG